MDEEKLLEILINAQGYVSGERISRELDVSRTAVWKAVNKLRSTGFIVLSSTNRGYMLADGPDMIIAGRIRENLNTSTIGKNIYYFRECDSTNEMARKGEREGHKEGSVYITDFQNSGKGRMGRQWFFERNKAIAMSILLKPEVSPDRMMPVSLIAGISVAGALSRETGVDCKLKWPNDILINGRKAGGILAEASIEGEYAKYIILGIGLNCNIEHFPDYIKNTATSLMIESGKECSRELIICAVLELFEKYYFEWLNENGKNLRRYSYSDVYRDKCITLGKKVTVISSDKEFSGTAEDIDELGNLQIISNDNEKIVLSSGEVSVRGENGYY